MKCPVRATTNPDRSGRSSCQEDATTTADIDVDGDNIPVLPVCAKHKAEIEADPGRWRYANRTDDEPYLYLDPRRAP